MGDPYRADGAKELAEASQHHADCRGGDTEGQSTSGTIWQSTGPLSQGGEIGAQPGPLKSQVGRREGLRSAGDQTCRSCSSPDMQT